MTECKKGNQSQGLFVFPKMRKTETRLIANEKEAVEVKSENKSSNLTFISGF